MSLLSRLLRRRSASPLPAAPPVPVDEALEAWVDAALRLAPGAGPGGRLVLAVLGESLADGRPSYWFGHEPTRDGWATLLAAVGEEPDVAAELCRLELGMTGGRLGTISEESRARWRAFVADALGDRDAARSLPARDPVHLEAEDVWRRAAASVQPWRVVRLDPDRALGQVRWYPGCPTRTFVGYADPLGLAEVMRSVSEHRGTDGEWQLLRRAQELADREVDPLAWRLSSVAFAAGVDTGAARR